jgi:hypothetical protein
MMTAMQSKYTARMHAQPNHAWDAKGPLALLFI